MTDDTKSNEETRLSDPSMDPSTELKQVRKAHRNEVILATMMDSYGLADMQGRFVDANPAFHNMLGYSREEFLQLSVPEIEAAMDPETVKVVFGRIAEQGHARFETRQRRKDGSIIDVEVSASIAEIDGEPFVFAFEIF